MRTHLIRGSQVLIVASLAGLVAAWGGFFRAEPYPSWEETGVSQKLNLFTFYEEDQGLRVFAGAEIMQYHDDQTYFPMQIAVGNGNAKPVTIGRDEFVLTDDKGVYYPLAEQTDLLSEYRKSNFDRTLLERSQFLGNKFVGFERIPSLFYPNLALTGVLNDHIQLPKGTYLEDVLYLRKPEGPLTGRTFTLTVYFPEQERQMDVKFILPERKKKS